MDGPGRHAGPSLSGAEALTTCACGQTVMAAEGEPIMRVACYCTSCRTAGEQLAALPGAPSILEADGGTRFVLWRKDRVRFTAGAENLRAFRLKPDSPTRRLVAACCNSAMCLEFNKGHWFSVYQSRGNDDGPIELRTMTRDKRPDVELPNDVPSSKTQSGTFMWRLLKAWFAMRLRTPAAVDYPALELPTR